MRTAIFGLLIATIATTSGNDNPEFEKINTKFPLHWKAKIGAASFRSNITVSENEIFVGSNGENFMDYSLFDKTSGVYKVNRKTGKIVSHFANESLGDMDVNGILSYKGNLYFGNDNEEFLCTTTDGKIIWRNPASGDIEHEPVIINNKGDVTLVYASELGEVCGVNPENGNVKWSYYTPDFSGWKPGDNRNVFKVKAYFSNTGSFFTKPELADLNNDGVDDLIYLTFDKSIYAINGSNGKLLWKNESDFNLSFNFSVLKNGNSPKIVLVSYEYNRDKENYTYAIQTLNASGKKISEKHFENNSYGFGLNHMKLNGNNLLLNTSDSIIVMNETGVFKKMDHAISYDYTSWYGNQEKGNRNSHEALFANKTFSYKGFKNCVLILNQQDNAYYENGFIEIFSLDKEKIIERLAIPSRSEMPPVIEDVNKDGYLDLLINCYDGYLYCYNLNIKA